MAVYTDPRPCYHQADTFGIYLAYVGAAPWNLGFYLRLINQKPLFDDVGVVLLSLLVRESVELGHEGRAILHAAPGSEGFYRNCGILELGEDEPLGSPLIRFEITTERAQGFLGKSHRH